MSDVFIMYIESLELDNFKSFGFKKILHFKKGFTIISGPNGSGKSNIGDAFLFVLGTRSSKTIRVDRLFELIHKPSQDQKQKNYCRVSITIDSEQENLPEDARKTKITRELVREGEEYKSNYYLNDQRVKKYDIEDYLQRVQLLLDSYSFVLQGDINNIFKMTGMERRKLLESIAGIESYNIQIEKAKSDIDGIMNNLRTIETLRVELTQRVESLKLQKEDALNYNRYVEEINNLNATILKRELMGLSTQIEALKRQAVEIERNENELKQKRQEISTCIESNIARIRETERRKERISGQELKDITDRVNAVRIKKAEDQIRRSNLEDESGKLESEKANLETEDGEISGRIVELENLKSENNARSTELTEKVRFLEGELKKISSEGDEISEDIFKMQTDLKSSDDRITSLNREIEKIVQEQKSTESTKEKKITELAMLETQKGDLEFEAKDARWRLKQISEVMVTRKADLEAANSRFIELRRLISEKTREKDALVKRMMQENSEYERISHMVSSQNPTSRPLQAIYRATSSGEITGVIGKLKELISFDEKFRSAVEASAGARLNALVVEDDGVAEKCLSILKRERAGKLTFLPLNKVVTGRPRGKAILIRNSGESLGYVSENIKYDGKYENVIWYCFQDTLIMADVTSARKNMGGVRLVTLDGDIFETSGAITGGFIERAGDQASLEQKASRLSASISEISANVASLGDELSRLQNEMQEAGTRIAELSKTEGESGSQTSSYSEIIKSSEDKISSISGRITELKREIELLDSLVLTFEKKIGDISVQIDQENSTRSAIYSKLEKISPELIARKKEVSDRLDSARTDAASILVEINRLTTEESVVKRRKSEISRRIQEITVRLKEIAVLDQQIAAIMQESMAELEKLKLLEEQIDSRNKELNREIEKLSGENKTYNATVDDINVQLSSLHDSHLSLNIRVGTLGDKYAETEAKMGEAKGTPLETDMTSAQMKARITFINEEIEKMGPINLRAIEDYDHERDNLEKMNMEIGQLNDERTELESLMDKLNEQKKVIFLRLVSNINERMQSIYYVLSNGGEARLEISDENDPLNAEVFISARPKGNNFNKIELLSGGEKSVTALAFIMAVQRISPSPVYYLDEIDMYLDGTNAERIGKMFMENSYTAQTIVVTLKRSLLKYANQMIGVTSFDGVNTEIFEKEIKEMGDVKEEESNAS